MNLIQQIMILDGIQGHIQCPTQRHSHLLSIHCLFIFLVNSYQDLFPSSQRRSQLEKPIWRKFHSTLITYNTQSILILQYLDNIFLYKIQGVLTFSKWQTKMNIIWTKIIVLKSFEVYTMTCINRNVSSIKIN